ncbi:MAG TPA: cobalamin B12-binding domain-containing protein [Thermomicrobiales bacterium]|nr:cobalamin B12-binding domain-containing protein [Thermomicrobiales bacterium]
MGTGQELMAASGRSRPIRVLVAKPGLDGHDRGAKVMARAFRDAGFEVIYTGLFQTPQMIANAALQEDVDVVGLSILSGAHMSLFSPIMDALRDVGREDVLVVAGGTIPDEDIPTLNELGVAKIFGPGTPLQDAVAYIREHAPDRVDLP